jgi:hypothetical protein
MAEQKRMMTILGQDMEVADVPIVSMNELPSEYELEDGSVLRVRNVATQILRVEGQFTPDGRPVYLVLTAPAVAVKSSTLKPTNR